MPKEYNHRKEAEARRLKILKQVFKNSINDEFENTTYKNYTRIKPSIIERDFPIFLNNFGMDN